MLLYFCQNRKKILIFPWEYLVNGHIYLYLYHLIDMRGSMPWIRHIFRMFHVTYSFKISAVIEFLLFRMASTTWQLIHIHLVLKWKNTVELIIKFIVRHLSNPHRRRYSQRGISICMYWSNQKKGKLFDQEFSE